MLSNAHKHHDFGEEFSRVLSESARHARWLLKSAALERRLQSTARPQAA
jgi:hypothetical protein